MAEAAEATISVHCSCGKKLKAPAKAIGKKAKCPKCGNVLTVEAPPPPDEDSLDALYDLAAAGEQAAAQEQLTPRCPGCQSEMEPGAVLCTNCGFNTKTGKSVVAKEPKAKGTRFDPEKAKAAALEYEKTGKKGPIDKMAPQASYWKGLGACCGGAAIGGVVWFLIAWGTGYELYFVVLLVAGLAGMGMQWGQQGYSYAGGFTAAGVTLITLILARLAVIAAIILPMMQSEEDRRIALQIPDLSQYDERIVDKLYEDYEKKNPPPPEQLSDEDEDEEESDEPTPEDKYEAAAYQAIEKQLKAMPKAQYAAMVEKFDREERLDELEGYLYDEIMMNELHVNPDSAGRVQREQASKLTKERIAAMNQHQRDAEHKRLHTAAEAEREKAIAARKAERAARQARGEDDGEAAARGAAVAIGGIVIFWLIFGGIKGAFWTICALGLAYRTASGSVSDS